MNSKKPLGILQLNLLSNCLKKSIRIFESCASKIPFTSAHRGAFEFDCHVLLVQNAQNFLNIRTWWHWCLINAVVQTVIDEKIVETPLQVGAAVKLTARNIKTPSVAVSKIATQTVGGSGAVVRSQIPKSSATKTTESSPSKATVEVTRTTPTKTTTSAVKSRSSMAVIGRAKTAEPGKSATKKMSFKELQAQKRKEAIIATIGSFPDRESSLKFLDATTRVNCPTPHPALRRTLIIRSSIWHHYVQQRNAKTSLGPQCRSNPPRNDHVLRIVCNTSNLLQLSLATDFLQIGLMVSPTMTTEASKPTSLPSMPARQSIYSNISMPSGWQDDEMKKW